MHTFTFLSTYTHTHTHIKYIHIYSYEVLKRRFLSNLPALPRLLGNFSRLIIWTHIFNLAAYLRATAAAISSFANFILTSSHHQSSWCSGFVPWNVNNYARNILFCIPFSEDLIHRNISHNRKQETISEQQVKFLTEASSADTHWS